MENKAIATASLARRFAASLSQSLPSSHPQLQLAELFETCPLLASATRAMAEQWLVSTGNRIAQACSAVCESPIEIAMCYALAIAGRSVAEAILLDFGEAVYGDAEGAVTLRIQPQSILGEYRADFLLTLQRIEDLDSGPRITQSQLVVECDGFDYHDRTREQAIGDRMRDRALQESGFRIFRYAGPEIWADVFGCARQALGFLSAQLFSAKKPCQCAMMRSGSAPAA